MNNKHSDIGDDEIRIIISDDKKTQSRTNSKLYVGLAIAFILLLTGVILFLSLSSDDEIEEEIIITQNSVVEDSIPKPIVDAIVTPKAFTSHRDTIVNNVRLSILIPNHSTPTLTIGADAINDSSAVLVAQAADIRADNGEIVGTYVVNGQVVSKGEAKSGFCSIINGEITVGVADATPLLEQALMSDGYFFRQYPLVVGGQIVENKPKGRAIRKALAEIDGRICVIISHDRLTFHQFSQALTETGVRNAIYLVGSDSSGFYIDEDGNKHILGSNKDTDIPNVNFIVWH